MEESEVWTGSGSQFLLLGGWLVENGNFMGSFWWGYKQIFDYWTFSSGQKFAISPPEKIALTKCPFPPHQTFTPY